MSYELYIFLIIRFSQYEYAKLAFHLIDAFGGGSCGEQLLLQMKVLTEITTTSNIASANWNSMCRQNFKRSIIHNWKGTENVWQAAEHTTHDYNWPLISNLIAQRRRLVDTKVEWNHRTPQTVIDLQNGALVYIALHWIPLNNVYIESRIYNKSNKIVVIIEWQCCICWPNLSLAIAVAMATHQFQLSTYSIDNAVCITQCPSLSFI